MFRIPTGNTAWNPPEHLSSDDSLVSLVNFATLSLSCRLIAKSVPQPLPGGSTALLCTGVDGDTIKLIGHWQSDAMLRYCWDIGICGQQHDGWEPE